MDIEEFMANGCFSPGWIEKEGSSKAPHRKELDILLGELEEIKNKIEDVQAKQWYLARLMQYHQEGFSKT